MDDEERVLLRACSASPQDDRPRFLYADWLEGHGDSRRAEFIRLSIAAADPAQDETRRAECQTRAEQLLADHRTAWEQPLRELGVAVPPDWCHPPPPVTYERGLSVGVIMTLEAFLAHGHEIQSVAPSVTRLDLNSQDLLDAGVERLVACPHLAGYRELNLRNNRLQDAAARAIASCPHLGQLRALDLGMNAAIGIAGVNALRDSPYFPQDMTIDFVGIGRPIYDPPTFSRFCEMVTEMERTRTAESRVNPVKPRS